MTDEKNKFKTVEAKDLICTNHGGNPIRIGNFYMATNVSIYKGIGLIPICKRCLYEIAENYYEHYKDVKSAIYYVCRKIDVPFNNNIFESALKTSDGDLIKTFQSYMRQYNSLGDTNNVHLPFDEGEHLDTECNCDKKEDESLDIVKLNYSNMFDDTKMTKDDMRIKREIIDILESDPFQGYSEADQKFLYNDLINYFADEDTHEDPYLLSQIIQIVNNNNQIRKVDYLISQYTADMDLLVQNETKVKSLNSIKRDIVANNDRIAKENRISVKNRSGGNIRKSSITVMMEYLRGLDFEDAEIDYYDQRKAYGMKRAADISMQAIAEQIQFDENDVNEIIIEQREMVKSMEEKILDLEEENRGLLVKVRGYKK